jgi:lysozyme family protein
LSAYRGQPATVEDVKRLTKDEAKGIYRTMYIRPFDAIPFESLRVQLVDYGVTSGPETAIRALQAVLGVPVDGIIGPRTLTALSVWPWRFVNNSLVAVRVKGFSDLVDSKPDQLKWFHGWCRRAVQFTVTT